MKCSHLFNRHCARSDGISDLLKQNQINKDVIFNRKQLQWILQELLQKKRRKYIKVIYRVIQKNKVKLMSAPKF